MRCIAHFLIIALTNSTMDAFTLISIAIIVALIVGVCLVAYLCQRLENYIQNNILNKE